LKTRIWLSGKGAFQAQLEGAFSVTRFFAEYPA